MKYKEKLMDLLQHCWKAFCLYVPFWTEIRLSSRIEIGVIVSRCGS
jgi:hypothetical protein